MREDIPGKDQRCLVRPQAANSPNGDPLEGRRIGCHTARSPGAMQKNFPSRKLKSHWGTGRRRSWARSRDRTLQRRPGLPLRQPNPCAGSARRTRSIPENNKTKRSELLAVLGKPTQEEPFYYHDLHKANRPVGSLEILKSPVRASAPAATAPARNLTTAPGIACRSGLARRLR
jgi:hypothetical protein